MMIPLSLLAQTAELSGYIKDPQAAGVPNATVELRNEDTGAVSRAKTNADGIYALPSLVPGTYDATVQATGFRTSTRDGIVLQVEQRARLDIMLELGAVEEKVTVQDAPTLVQDTPEIETSITRREYESLPMIQIGRIRSPAAFVLLAPGVQGSVRLDGLQYSSASNQVEVHGQANFTIEYLVDGLAAGWQTANFNESAPAVDAVREFRLLTAQLSPEYGASGSAVASFSLMSGTNQLHGDFYDYLRNSDLDARSFTAPNKPPLRLNEFGGSIGGPVVLPRLFNGKDHTFFFFSYGGSRKHGADYIGTYTTYPTPAETKGDFSGLANSAGQPVTIFDPTNVSTDSNGNLIRNPFPGNVIPANRIDPAAARIASLYPAPNSPSGYTNFYGERLLDPDSFTGKVDHEISNRHHLSEAIVRTHIPRLFYGGELPLPLTASPFSQTVTSWTARINDDFILTPTLLNTFAVGYNRFHSPLNPPTPSQPWSTELGIHGIGSYAFPYITFGNGYPTVGSTNFFNWVDQTFLAKDSVSWQHGSHSFRFGGEWRYNEHSSIVTGYTMGAFNFTSAFTANPAALTSTGNSFASFLLGGYNSASSSGPYNPSVRWQYGGLYGQDQWRVSPHLTLTWGLRWEWQTPAYETRNQSGEVSLTTPNPGAGNLPGAVVFAGGPNGRSFGSTDLSSFGPRVGLAWDVLKRTVFRAGYGIYYDKWFSGGNVGGIQQAFGIDSPGYQASYSATSQNSGLTPAGLLSAGLPTLPTAPNLSPTVLNGLPATFVDPSSWKMPRVQNWSAGIQRQLTEEMVFEASYVGIHGTRENAYLLSNINQLDPKYLSLGSLLNQSISSPAAAAAGIAVPYPGFTGFVVQALRPFPQYQTITSYLAKLGKSSYNALELHLRQRFHNGLSFDVNYTWSKNLGYADTMNIGVGGVNAGYGNLPENAYNLQKERSLLPNDVPQAFVAAWVYDLPFGSGHKLGAGSHLIRALLSGWTASATQRYQSGTPLQIYADNLLPLSFSAQRPNIVSGQSPQTDIGVGSFNPGADRRINLSAFSVPLPFTFGNSAPTYGNLRNFAVLQEDVALTRSISLGERWKLELYGQSFNVANRHRFTNFGTDVSSPSFGQSTSSSVGRYVQLGAKIQF
ncbi:MAG TPA: TonB-dependent receptor [Bryobacteraceae bacterium]|nr:TonB-dependent receptor [Bryobacteraceae bacterium]